MATPLFRLFDGYRGYPPFCAKPITKHGCQPTCGWFPCCHHRPGCIHIWPWCFWLHLEDVASPSCFFGDNLGGREKPRALRDRHGPCAPRLPGSQAPRPDFETQVTEQTRIQLLGGCIPTPLKNMTSSIGMMRFPIFLGK